MAHFAKLDENNIVIEINVVDNRDLQDLPFPDSEPLGIAFLTEWSGGHQNWKQTSYNANFRRHYAGIGYSFDEELNAFIPPQPYPSWTLNKYSCLWEPPVPHPDGYEPYTWNEETLSWDLVGLDE